MARVLYGTLFLVVIVHNLNLIVTQNIQTLIDTSSCGILKSCLRQPDQCSAGSCQFVLTWSYNLSAGGVYDFEMEAAVSTEGSWVALGLSYDQYMGKDSVVECVFNDQTGTASVRVSWNVNGHSNELLTDGQLGLVAGSTAAGYVNGYIVCKFQRAPSVSQTSNYPVYPLNGSDYYILLAEGPAVAGVKAIHSLKLSSDATTNFSTVVDLSISSQSSSQLSINLIKAHGILMVFAWMVFASFGMLFPRL